MVKLNDEQKVLAEQNHNLIYHFAYKYNLPLEEWYGILAIGYLQGIAAWDPERGKLSTFVSHTMRVEWFDELKKMRMAKRKAVVVSLNEPLKDKSGADVGDYTEAILTSESIEDLCVMRTDLKRIVEGLTNLQRKVLFMCLEGKTQREIAAAIGKTQIQKVRILKPLADYLCKPYRHRSGRVK